MNKVFTYNNDYTCVVYDGPARNEYIFDNNIPLDEDGLVEVEVWSLSDINFEHNGQTWLVPFNELIPLNFMWNEKTISHE